MKRKKKNTHRTYKGDLNLLSALQRFSVFLTFIHCSDKLEISFVFIVHNVKGKCWDTSNQIQQAVLLGVLKDTNFAPVSTAPARLHRYLLEKAQFGLLKPVLTQGYQVFLSYYYIYIYSWSVKDTDKCRDLKKKKEVESLGFEGALSTTRRCAVVQFTKEL